MSDLVSKLLEPVRHLRLRIPGLGPHNRDDKNNERIAYKNSPKAFSRGLNDKTEPNWISLRKYLDRLSRLRIHSSALEFVSVKPHGSGGKAEVVQAILDRGAWSDKLPVAVKQLRTHADMNKRKFCNEFVHEVDIMAGLSHENIVQLIGFVEDLETGKAWIVLSWEPNGNVSEFLATGKWEVPERLSLIQDIVAGVQYLHTRQPPICHGDLKSFNILVTSSYHAVITDFGSARALNDSELVDTAVIETRARQAEDFITDDECPQIQVRAAGNQLTLTGPAWSLRWAPPEVVNGDRPGLPSDIWATGWVCWEIMTNQVPFPDLNSAGAITLRVVQGDVPSAREDAQLSQITRLCSLMTDCWTFDPKKRPSIAQCWNDVKWMPSIPPSGGSSSDSKVLSSKLLLGMGWIHYWKGCYEQAASLLEQGLDTASDENNQKARADIMYALGHVYSAQNRYKEAKESYTQAQDIYGCLGSDQGQANMLKARGHVYFSQSRYIEAEGSYVLAQELYGRIGHDQGQANSLTALGDVYRARLKYLEAEESYTRAQEIYGRIGSDQGRANTLIGMGHAYMNQSKYDMAEKSYTQAQKIYDRIGDGQGQANTLMGLARLYRKRRPSVIAVSSCSDWQFEYK